MLRNPFDEGYLPPCDGHQIYYASYGATHGPVILNIHGGPGLHSQAKYAAQFDLTRHCVITFDQRGCGRSQFSDRLQNNSLEKTITDIERLRQHLSIRKWYLNGGSWGSTLALAYTQHYPENVTGLMIASTFLGDHDCMRWLYGDSNTLAERRFPHEYATYRQFLDRFSVKTQSDLAKVARLLVDGERKTQEEIVHAILRFERRMYVYGDIASDQYDISDRLIEMKMVYMHYASNHFFLSDRQISNDTTSFANTPILLVHGEYDTVCPIDEIRAFARRNKSSSLLELPDNGHSFNPQGKAMSTAAYAQFLKEY